MKFQVKGFCLVPCEASIEVEASSEADALKKARVAWANSHSMLIDQGSVDFSAAFDWQPSAEKLNS